jgi:hypothetical protein
MKTMKLTIGLALTMPTLGLGWASPAPAASDWVPERGYSVRNDESTPLRDAVPVPADGSGKARRVIPLLRGARPAVIAGQTDPIVQRTPGPLVNATIGLNFDGQGSTGVAPPDPNGAAGATQYVQWVNSVFNVYDRVTGTKLAGPLAGNQFWAGFGGDCETHNDGDPIIKYDQLADRWVATQFALNFGANSFSQCVAVSQTSDALGSYNRYQFNFGNKGPDYPKLGVWPDAYYLTSRTFLNFVLFQGPRVCAMDRAAMLVGAPALIDCFQGPPTFDFVLPGDLDGTTLPPAGSPNYMMTATGVPANRLGMAKFFADFVGTPHVSVVSIPVAAYTPGPDFIPQPSPGEQLDGFGGVLMYRLPYRNFGDHQSIVAAHSVDKGGGIAAIRWYEIRTPDTPTVFQQGTFPLGATDLWMPSIAMDKMGNIAVGFSASSASVKPSLGFTGRMPGDPLGTMESAALIVAGTGVQQATSNRWGDYASMVPDPNDDCTLWFTSEYIKTTGSFNWSTRIANLKFNGCQ